MGIAHSLGAPSPGVGICPNSSADLKAPRNTLRRMQNPFHSCKVPQTQLILKSSLQLLWIIKKLRSTKGELGKEQNTKKKDVICQQQSIKLIRSHNLKPTNRKDNWRAITENKHQSQKELRARWKSFCCLHPSLMLALPSAQQPRQSIVMSPRLVEALIPCPTQGCVLRSPGACLVKSLMFYSGAFREERSAEWLLIHKTAILCSSNKIPQRSSELALHCCGPDKAHRFLSVKCSCYSITRGLCCASVSVSASKCAAVSQAHW